MGPQAMNWLQSGLTVLLLVVLAVLSIDATAMLICKAHGVTTCAW